MVVGLQHDRFYCRAAANLRSSGTQLIPMYYMRRPFHTALPSSHRTRQQYYSLARTPQKMELKKNFNFSIFSLERPRRLNMRSLSDYIGPQSYQIIYLQNSYWVICNSLLCTVFENHRKKSYYEWTKVNQKSQKRLIVASF